MGLGDFFRRRRERESAIPPAAQQGEAPGSFADSEGQPVIGEQVSAGAEGISFDASQGLADSLATLSMIGPMIQKAIAEGTAQVEIHQSRAIDMAGTDLSAEIREIMKTHGADADPTAANVNPAAYAQMQQEILQALARHGIDTGTGAGPGASPADK